MLNYDLTYTFLMVNDHRFMVKNYVNKFLHSLKNFFFEEIETKEIDKFF